MNFATQANASGLTYGLTAAEITQIGQDNDVIQFLADAAVTIDAYDDAVRAYRKVITEGDIGDPTPAFPVNMDLSLPVVIPTGMFERLNNYVERIRASAAYTPETGAIYGIIPQASEGFNPAEEVVEINATVDPGNLVNVTFVRGRSDGIRVEIAIDKGPWTSQGNYMKSPVVLEVPQNEDELPRSVQIRARYLDGNTPVGDWSDIVTVQTIP
jgi:hypothetical protein